jgi:hypothetical protein
VRAEPVPQPAKAPRLVLMIMRMVVGVALKVIPMPEMVAVMVAALMIMPVARAGRLAHAAIVRDEMRFRTSTVTRNAHLPKGRNYPAVSRSNSHLS